MIFIHGTLIAASLGLMMLVAGYGVAGFLVSADRITRLTVASLVGLAWVIWGGSLMGAVRPLDGVSAGLIWSPVLLTCLIPTTRNQLRADFLELVKSPLFYAAVAGLTLLWIALLLPCIIYPDLVFFDGKPNHDNFFWCAAADYLQHHEYLSVPVENHEFPLYNLVKSITGWKPVWGRMGAEGFIAVASSTARQSPIELYNFLVCILVLPWLLTVLAIARRMGLASLNRVSLGLICFCQPVLFFFIANGNLPNLFGAVFSGGLWLISLLIGEPRFRVWPVFVAGALFVHGLLCCYPEIAPFAFIPIGFLISWNIFRSNAGRAAPFLFLAAFVLIGLCLNPLSTERAWNGFWNSIDQVRQDTSWANVFGQLTFAGYVPSLITLAMPSMRLYGVSGGLVASAGVLITFVLLIRQSRQAGPVLLISLSGFFVMLGYTLSHSFDYGWQKSVQFFGIPLAVLFPALFVGMLRDAIAPFQIRRLSSIALVITLVVMLHGMVGSTADNLKSAGSKGVTHQLLTWRDRLAQDFTGQPVHVDGATFRGSFFHSMWSARLFSRNPLNFFSRQDQAGGYLRTSINVENPTTPATNGLYYVAANWAEAFDYAPAPVFADRVGVLLKQHNLVTEFNGFYRTSGVPQMVKADFSITVYPYADGWLEFTLEANGSPLPHCQLEGTISTDADAQNIKAEPNAAHRFALKFPLKQGAANRLAVHIEGAPAIDPAGEDPPYPFYISNIRSYRTNENPTK